MGISDEMIRLSVGIGAAEDVLGDRGGSAFLYVIDLFLLPLK